MAHSKIGICVKCAVQFLYALHIDAVCFSSRFCQARAITDYYASMGTQIIPLSSPARRVLEHLRRGPMTVEELAGKTRVTANAVRNQLARLIEANLVERIGTRPGPSKPSIVYAITLEGEVQFSTIYLPVLTQFLRTAEKECGSEELVTFMTDTGTALGKRYPKPAGPLKTRVSAAAQLFRALGGIPKVRSENGSVVIESLSCPLSALTGTNAAACRILEGLVGEYVGAATRTCCTREPAPRCCFQISGKEEDQRPRA